LIPFGAVENCAHCGTRQLALRRAQRDSGIDYFIGFSADRYDPISCLQLSVARAIKLRDTGRATMVRFEMARLGRLIRQAGTREKQL